MAVEIPSLSCDFMRHTYPILELLVCSRLNYMMMKEREREGGREGGSEGGRVCVCECGEAYY